MTARYSDELTIECTDKSVVVKFAKYLQMLYKHK